MDHGLDADADGFDEDVIWVDIDDKAAEESEGGDVIHASASDPISDLIAIWEESDDWENVKRGGAKLIWEGIPHIAPGGLHQILFVDMEGEDNLFIDLKDDHDDPSNHDDAAECLVIRVFEEMAD